MNKKETYQLTKEMLFQKFGGVCAFCGFELGERWHIWDIESSKTLVSYRGEIIIGNDTYENKLPACHSCNSTRVHANGYNRNTPVSIEQFRKFLYHEFDFLREAQHTAYAYYKKAIKYGLLVETGNEIVFHFEKHI